MRYLDIIEELSQSKKLHQGDIDGFSKEILKAAASYMHIQRSNAWLFNKDQSILRSLQSYNSDLGIFQKEESLHRKDIPNYFMHLTKNKIIASNDALREKMYEELVDNYLIPKRIKSMVDVPLRSGGKMVGVMCFEAVDESYEWTDSDIKFVQSLAQLLSIAIESSQKNTYRKELESTIEQKEVLLSEINHRVKNNMAVIIGLINLQKHKCKDDFHQKVLEELQAKIYSMALVQNHLHNNRSLVKVELGRYLTELIENINHTYGHGKEIDLKLNFEKVVVDISKGIPIGLIANEVLTNSFKYAFGNGAEKNILTVRLLRGTNEVNLIIKDNGPGFKLEDSKDGMGLELIHDLVEQISGQLEIRVEGGTEFGISFPLD